jgi:hypothetical protein
MMGFKLTDCALKHRSLKLEGTDYYWILDSPINVGFPGNAGLKDGFFHKKVY